MKSPAAQLNAVSLRIILPYINPSCPRQDREEPSLEHAHRETEAAEQLVSSRCESAIDMFLDVCQQNPARSVVWGSEVDPWSFRVTFVDHHWILGEIEFEIEGVEDLFEGEDLRSRDGVDHVIASVMVPLAMEAALGEIPDRTAEQFLTEMETRSPVVV